MKPLSLILLLIFGFSEVAEAGPFTDEMAKCLAKTTTEADKVLFIQWTYAAISSHPAVESLSNISPEIREDLNQRAANMVTDLITVRCKTETMQAVKFEGDSALRASFEVLGRVAMQGLMSDPNVARYMAGLPRYFDPEKFRTTFK